MLESFRSDIYPAYSRALLLGVIVKKCYVVCKVFFVLFSCHQRTMCVDGTKIVKTDANFTSGHCALQWNTLNAINEPRHALTRWIHSLMPYPPRTNFTVYLKNLEIWLVWLNNIGQLRRFSGILWYIWGAVTGPMLSITVHLLINEY